MLDNMLWLCPDIPVIDYAIAFSIKSYFFIACLILEMVVKKKFYQLIGKLWGLDVLTGRDEFWLYDFPISPMNLDAMLQFGQIHTKPE